MATPKSKSTKPPAFQFYPADFINDDAVEDMSFTEIGVYVVMLCKDWLGKGLPTDLAKIAARISSGNHTMTEARLKKIWEGPLARCFEAKSERLYNPRLELERRKQRAYSKEQSDRGKLGGRPTPKRSVSDPKSGGFSDSKARARDETNRDETSQVVQEEKNGTAEFDGQKAFMALVAEYPSHRRDDSQPTQVEFLKQLQEHGPTRAEAFVVMLDNLRNHNASEEWQRGIVPNMENWLEKGKWKRRYPPAGAASSSQGNAKTAGNIPAFKRFIERGQTS